LISAGLAGPLAAQTTKSVAKDIGVSELQLKQIMDIRAMSLEAVSKLPKEKIPGLLRRIEHPNLPKERYDARALSYRDPRGGDSNVAGLLSSMKHMKALQSRAPKGLVAGVPTGPEAEAKELVPLAKSITETNWVWLGPGNVGGRTRTLVFHPQNPNLIFAGSVSGGVWRSTDGGANWFPSSALLSNLCVTSLVFDPSDNNVMYAATGEGFIGNLGMRGGGIFKSTDAGQTWSHLPSTDHQSFLQVSRLAISPAGNVLLAATEQGIRRSVDKGQSWSSPMLWERIADVKYHPTDNRKAIAAGQNNGNIWFTEDGGLNWTMSTFWQAKGGRVELTYAKANPNRIYASMDLNSGTLYRSDDGGKVFYQMNGQIQHLGKQGFYDNAIWAGHPTNADLLIVGGLNLHRSVDGGASFQQISIWNNSKSVHADQHFIVEHPKFGTPFDPNEKTVYFCNDGGIFRTQDVYNVGSDWFAQPPYGAGWQEVNWNYGVVQFGGLAVTPSGKVIAGAQDNGNLIYTPAQGPYAWAKPAGAGGDGAFCAADPTNESYLYCEYVRLSLSRTGNGGQSFELIDGSRWVFLNGKWEQFWKNAPYVLGDARDRKALFYAPFVMDPQNPQRLFAGGQSLWRT
ncbi:MAG: hypothetical protein KDA41_04810, partial [Planctomycetales bacterium]|nr:hypothetical protein [Planctomycetales bacterium]